MRILGIVQARMGSTRLPGKVMKEIAGKPMIGHLLDRVALSQHLDGVVVAAPARDAGSTLADYVLSRGVCFHASRDDDDVAGRFIDVLDSFPDYSAFIRICGDSPLLPTRTIDTLAGLLRKGEPIVSNVGCRVNIPGQHAEGIFTHVYRANEPQFSDADREHAGFPFFYRCIEAEPGFAVDTEEDFQRVSRIIECRS